MVRVCLVAYPPPWGVPLELALLQRVLPLTFNKISENVQKSFPHNEYNIIKGTGGLGC